MFGGYGTFGGRVCEALAGWGIPVVVAGRDARRARAAARRLGAAHRGEGADASRGEALVPLLRRAAVAVNCVGSVAGEAAGVFAASLAAGCHYVDISECRAGAARVREADAELRRRRRVAAYGCSSLPGISGALAAAAARAAGVVPTSARVTLAIGQRNPKGRAAVAALAAQAGRVIEAPQGRLRALVDRFTVTLPPPFGHRSALVFETPDYDLLARLGLRSVEVGVVFELRPAARCLALAARLGPRLGPPVVRLLGRAGGWLGHLGTSGGALQVDLEDGAGGGAVAVVRASASGQRLGALPAALATRALLLPGDAAGALAAVELLGSDALLRSLAAEGLEVRLPDAVSSHAAAGTSGR